MLEAVFFIVAGFIAQMIDGALGMAYGVSLNSMLISFGFSPAVASLNVHASEMFTSLASGLSHLKIGNVNLGLLKKLLIAGVIGGVAGVCTLVLVPTEMIKPIVSAYLLIMGIVIIMKAVRVVRRTEFNDRQRGVPLLALFGGFLDAVGGGGWGPIVTSTLIARGGNPKISIGTVNLAEFFVTISQVATFIVFLGTVQWHIILFIIIGGLIASPIAAYTCKKVPIRPLMIAVGSLICLLSLRNILLTILA
ncbi:MAG: sulfite exporter TauE/SafE family protein [Candidatus Caldarchaeales archaeon]